jgi:hypothetical protein
MKRFISLLFLVLLMGSVSMKAQIFQPEGVNIPGSWNGFTNTNEPSSMGNFRMNYRSFAGGQYVTTLDIRATGGDAAAGNYTMLFTSGPDDDTFVNKWADASLNIDGFTNLTYNSGADNTITVEDDSFYTFIFDDNGYANSSATVQKTSAIPVEISSVSGIPSGNVSANNAVTISVELDKAKSAEEKVFIRYSTDNFATSNAVEITNFSGANGTADIPGQSLNSVVEFYVLTTTLPEANWNSNVDLVTLAFENNEGSNFRYFYEANIQPVNGTTAVSTTPEFSWFSTDGAAGYDFQLSLANDFSTTVEDETALSDTTFSIVSPLAINTKYYWRFKTSAAAEWSNIYSFTTETEITFANLQFPSNVSVSSDENFTAYGQITVPGVTTSNGESSDISAWVAVNPENTDPSTWDESAWKPAAFFEDKTTTDEYSAEIGSNLDPAEYYFAFRYKYKDQNFVFGGINGFWDATSSGSGKLDVLETPQLVTPLNNATDISLQAFLDWTATDSRIQSFQLQIAEQATFNSILLDESELSASEYTISSEVLENETKYFWKVRAEYDTTASSWSETLAFTTIAGSPEKIALLTPLNNSEDITLKPAFLWSKESRSDNYSIQVSSSNGFENPTINTTVTDTQFVFSSEESLFAGTEYFWRVQGKNSSGAGIWSDTLTFKTLVKIPVLISPAEEQENVTVNPEFVWESISGALSYDLQLSESSSFSTTITDTSALTDTTFQALALENSTSYYWRVRANFAADTSDWSMARLFTTKAPAPSAPTLLSPDNNVTDVSTSPVLQWNSVADADSYHLQLSLTADFSTNIIKDSSGIEITSLQTDQLSKNTEFYWRVRATNDLTGNSDWSTVRSFTTIPEVPGDFELLSPSNNAENTALPITLIWSKAFNADEYRVQLSTEETFVFVSDTTTSDTTLVLPSLSASTTYYWRVQASNNGGITEWTAPFEFNTGISGAPGPALLSPLNNASNLRFPIEFKWDSLAQAESYTIQISTSSNFETLTVDSSGISNALIEISSLAKSNTYFWRVSAMTSSGSSAWSNVFSFETEKEIPAIPELIFPQDQSADHSSEIAFKWSDSFDASGYELRISRNEDFSFSIDSTVANDTTLTLRNFDFDTIYFWQVRALNASGKSTWSSVYTFSTGVPLPGIPELLSPHENDAVNDPVVFGWNKADYADSYHLQVSGQQSFESKVADTTNITTLSVEIDGLSESTEYYWRVRSQNNKGVGEWSETGVFMTQIFTSLENEELPATFKLYQNYPNPFNPATTIRYDLKTAGQVAISVFDITGKRVATIVQGKRSAGKHTVNFVASGLASGIYILRMETPGFTQIRKMTLIK